MFQRWVHMLIPQNDFMNLAYTGDTVAETLGWGGGPRASPLGNQVRLPAGCLCARDVNGSAGTLQLAAVLIGHPCVSQWVRQYGYGTRDFVTGRHLPGRSVSRSLPSQISLGCLLPRDTDAPLFCLLSFLAASPIISKSDQGRRGRALVHAWTPHHENICG